MLDGEIYLLACPSLVECTRELESIDPSSPNFAHSVPFVIALLFAPSLVLSLGTNPGYSRAFGHRGATFVLCGRI